jgi:hypothetical protein
MPKYFVDWIILIFIERNIKKENRYDEVNKNELN